MLMCESYGEPTHPPSHLYVHVHLHLHHRPRYHPQTRLSFFLESNVVRAYLASRYLPYRTTFISRCHEPPSSLGSSLPIDHLQLLQPCTTNPRHQYKACASSRHSND